ncbi:MAG: tyrosine-type recombinase/integrase [Candidatus Aenigmatarchaeota archaeon]
MAEFSSETMSDKKGYLTKDQVDRLLNAAGNLRDRLLLQLMYRCGRRVSEVLLLKKEDILWDDKMIIFTILKRKKPIKELKPVDEGTMKLLDLYVNENIQMHGLRKKMEDGRLFPITRQYVFKLMRKLGDKTGIIQVGKTKLHPHHLRHSFAIHAVRTSVKSTEDLSKLQRYMGHANISTTAHYLQFSPSEQRSIITDMWEKKKDKNESKK